jgi:hypothetical protein
MIIDNGNYNLSFQWDGQGRAGSSPYGNISSTTTLLNVL